MKIYFVRHGTTDSLEKRVSQPDDEPLNATGIQQARELANRFRNIDLDLVISSPFLRCLSTAKEIRKEVATNNLFVEVRKPKEVIGRSKEEEDVKKILDKIGTMYKIDPSWHYSDEENFEDLKERGLKALNFLENRQENNILVVTHGNFTALLIGLMLFGSEYQVEISLKLKRFLTLSNTGVTICTFEDGRWKMLCCNDTSHCLE